MGRNALYAVIRMPGRHSKSFTTTSSRQDDVQKKISVSRFVCVGMLVSLVAMSGLSVHSETNVRKISQFQERFLSHGRRTGHLQKTECSM